MKEGISCATLYRGGGGENENELEKLITIQGAIFFPNSPSSGGFLQQLPVILFLLLEAHSEQTFYRATDDISEDCSSHRGAGDLSTPTPWETPVGDGGQGFWELCMLLLDPAQGPAPLAFRPAVSEGRTRCTDKAGMGWGGTRTKGCCVLSDAGGFPFLTGQVGWMRPGIPGIS